MTVDDAVLASFVDPDLCGMTGALVTADRLDGNGVLWGNCPGCHKPHVKCEPVEEDPYDGWWYLLAHRRYRPASEADRHALELEDEATKREADL